MVSFSAWAEGDKAVKVGTKVVKSFDPRVVRTIIEMKTDFKGVWVRLSDDRYPDIWYNTEHLEIVNEDR